MITLITGVPGMGKTALLVQMLLELEKKGERPLFVMGVPDLKLEHSPCPPVEEWTHKVPDKNDPNLMLDYYQFPPNSILVVDEAQRVFRTRSAGTKPPPHVMALETHRHTGLDIILLTQKPLLLDLNARELTGRHLHIRNNLIGMRYLYEWFEFQDPNSKENLKEAIKRKYSPPKEVFNYYKSAEVHTKPPRRIHQVFYILFALIAFSIYNGYGLYKKFIDKSKPQELIVDKTTPKTEFKDNIINADFSEKTPEKYQTPPIEQAVQHPFIGYDFIIKGVLHSKRLNRTYYELKKDNRSVITNDTELKKLGYVITENNDCSTFLTFEGAFISASCDIQQPSDNAQTLALRAGGGAVSPPEQQPQQLIDGSDYDASPTGV